VKRVPKLSRILVIGSGEAGKTTFSMKLAERLKLPVVHLDRHFWKPGWVSVRRAEWRKKVRSFTGRKTWIMDGNYGGTYDIRFPRADLVVYFDFSPVLCLYRAIKRKIRFHGGNRSDMGPGCPEKIDIEFLLWIWNFRRTERPRVMEAIRKFRMKDRLVVLKTPAEAEEFLSR